MVSIKSMATMEEYSGKRSSILLNTYIEREVCVCIYILREREKGIYWLCSYAFEKYIQNI